jgi:hypothetical protein
MHWSVTIAMFAAVATNAPEGSAEFHSYSDAYWKAAEVHRPMLVILNPPGNSGAAVALESLKQDPAVRDVLDQYVVAVVDTGTEHGQKVYESFGRPALPRTVVIDQEQEKQIFRTSQKLQAATLGAILQQYRNGAPQPVTVARPVTGPVASPVVSPARNGSLNFYQQGGGNCPNCRRF